MYTAQFLNCQTWTQARESTVGGFSATCWFTATHLQDALQASSSEAPPPIGLMHSSLSGSCVEAWTSSAGIAACHAINDGHCPGESTAQHLCSHMFNGGIHPVGPTPTTIALVAPVATHLTKHPAHERTTLHHASPAPPGDAHTHRADCKDRDEV